jgi:voltage-gated potassium channel
MYLRIKRNVFRLLHEKANDSLLYKSIHLFLLGLIALNICAVNLETVAAIYKPHAGLFRRFDEFSLIVFLLEYIARIWTCTLDRRFKGNVTGRIKYALTPLALIDFLAVFPLLLPFLIPVDLRVIRILRLFRLLRIFNLARYTSALHIFARVVTKKKEEIVLSIFLVGVLLMISSSLIYFCEHDAQPVAFSSIPASLWWAVITLTSVGYGDIYPVTTPGKILGGIIAVLGIGVVALPTGIIATSMIEHFASARKETSACPHCGKPIHTSTHPPAE